MPIINAISNGSLRSFGVLVNRQRPVNLSVVGTVEVLVIGGGGGGAGPGNGGGGGSGGYSSSPAMSVTPATQYTVRIGAGGGSSANGSNTGIFTTASPGAAIIEWARGGGRGGGGTLPGDGNWGGPYPPANPDGYGGGGGGGNRPLFGVPPAGPGDPTFGGYAGPQGRQGGRGGFTPTNTGPVGQLGEPQFGGGGGGGGGATQAGGDGGDTITPYIYGGSWPFANNAPASITYENAWGGNGGNGISSTISGSTVYYCGGGGGGGDGGTNQVNIHAVGGRGGGGGGFAPNSPVGRRQYAGPTGALTGGNPGSGDSYTGGGGGSGSGQGGSGVVIIRYPISFARANATFISGEPIYSEDSSYRYYTFQGSGTIGFTPGTSVDP